jgi:outer membrane protein TolC
MSLKRNRNAAGLGLGSALLALCPSSCMGPAEAKRSADAEVYGILEKRRAQFAADPMPFTVEPPEDSLRQRLLSGTADAGEVLDLVDCLKIAAENSREYQRRKEELYLTALDLTFERYRFRLQEVGTLGVLVAGTGSDAEEFSADAGLTLSRLLGSGAQVIGSIGFNLFKSLSGGGDWDPSSSASLSVTQPLLRGFGSRIVLEPLTQAERDVVYGVRDFERFRRTFAVDVAARYYGILQQGDRVANEHANQRNLVILRERNEALAEAGRLSDVQLDQARQDELSSTNRVIQEEQRYAAQLDAFKFFLGLPVETAIVLDASELERLWQEGIQDIVADWEPLAAVALAQRLDHLTVLDQVDDRRRKVVVAADALRPGLGLNVAAAIQTPVDKPAKFDLHDLDWAAGLELDLPLDRLVERNSFRASLIALQASLRDEEELGDEIRSSVRDDLREAAATLETWNIQVRSVQLAERRVESARLNLEAGRVSTRDILEAQADLLDAQNQATQALIDHHLAILGLWRDMEVLRVDERGITVEESLVAGLLGGTP